MKLYFGFSKRLKLKTLIEILGFIFIGLLAFLGIDKVNADTLQHFDLSNATLSSSYTYAMTTSPDTDVYATNEPLYYHTSYFGNQSYMTLDLKNDSSGSQSLLGYSYINRTLSYQGNPMRVFKNVYYTFTNEDFCDTSQYKSNDLWIDILWTGDTTSYNIISANNFTYGDIWDVKFRAIDTNGDYYATNCYYSTYRDGPNVWDILTYNCPNVFIGNNNVEIEKYSIDIFNNLSQSDDILGTGDWKYIQTNFLIDMSDTTYQCMTSDPVIDFTTAKTLPSKPDIDNAIKKARDNYVVDIPGLNTDIFDIDYPQSIQEFISLPLYVLDNIVQRSETCTPYELDLSSLTHLGHNYQEVKITIPCMRTKLASLLGSLYTLIDVLLASIVFYNIAMAILQLIEAVTDGVDLWSFYFSNTDEGRKYRLWFWGDNS